MLLARVAKLEKQAVDWESRNLVIPPRPLRPLAEWSATYLAGHLTCRPSAFHEWLAGELTGLHLTRPQRLAVLAPRGNAKSTWSCLAYPLWCVLHGIEPYVVITSDTADQAQQHLRGVRQELESNPLLARDYPHLAGKLVAGRADNIELANGCRIGALGTGGKIRGRKSQQHRPSLIIVDDPQNLEHIISPVRRERSWDWLTRDVCNAGDPKTNIVVLGTALHAEAIVCRLNKTPGWRTKIFKSIIQWPVRMDLWNEWEAILHDWGKEKEERERLALAFYEQHREEMEA